MANSRAAKGSSGNKKTKQASGKNRVGLLNIKVGEIDLVFLILVLVLVVIGLLSLFSASYAYAYYNYGDSYMFISRQLMFAIAGIIAMLFISIINYQILYKLAWPVMGVTLILLVVVLAFPHDGARRWIDLGFTTLQPSEIAKFAIVLLFSHLCIRNAAKIKTFKYGVLPFAVILVVIVGLLVLEPHLSGIVIIVSLGALMMLIGGADLKWFVMAGIALLVAVVLFIATGAVGYASGRIESWLHPENDPRGAGFQILQSLYAIASGGFMGVGVGASRQKFLYLPEPQNDFIFSIVCEEIGFVGSTIVILIFALLLWRGFVISMRCKDRFGSLLAAGFTMQVGLQVILNIMVVTNTVPNTGISLPFFSYGGTALLMLLGQMGLILSISRQSNIEKK